MKDRTPKEKLLEYVADLPHLSFSRRPAATPEEGTDRSVLWGIKSLREVVQEADRRFGTEPKGRGKSNS
ncbi:hypothetical protein V1283_003040 [Bradyrhizobium sp. AZCC 2262]|uniref:hypothetical protein n=1 Tax=Bradyrhizobium sp. AZCC 2262 TaxID=3117022 RepID=UPI002FF36C37